MSDDLRRSVEFALEYVDEAERLIYAAESRRDLKDDVIEAHSALLRLRNKLGDAERVRSLRPLPGLTRIV